MKNKYKIISIISLTLAIIITIFLVIKVITSKTKTTTLNVNLSNLTLLNESMKIYNQEDFDNFLNDYQNNNLPSVYVTKFLFDGVSMYKPFDLDDFIEEGNDLVVDPLEITTININTTGDIELTGELVGGMIAVNTNNVSGNINILLNNVNIDTDSKKVPVFYIYNKDITSTNAKVTINALANTNNYLEGGKLKKVSLIPSDNLSEYTNKYSGSNQTNYETYTNYYGVYTASQINNILFASVTADNEDLQDGDPNYFYKAAGAISSDIDLYFEGKGYLEVTSKNKEGIETKGNLTFSGSTGDYIINAEDDCLNTTTNSNDVTNARNTLTIDVNSMYAIVSNDADEGDAIDSNGELIINNGLVVAIAKPGQDAGIDSEKGIYINGGTVLATGDMYDEVNSNSAQRFMVLSFNTRPSENDLITLIDESNNPIFSYKTDRSYSSLVYSSPLLSDSTYYLYTGGTIDGEEKNGYYTKINSYELGTQLAYSSQGTNNGMPGGNNNGNMTPPSGDMPNNNNGTPPEKPSSDNNMTPPSGDMPNNDNNMPRPDNNNQNSNTNASNEDFTLSGISNLFSGISIYSE